MTDPELLELAAKAAGITVIRSRLDDPLNLDMLIEGSARNKFQNFGAWNPLTDDGDAFRLAVKLNMEVYHADDEGWAVYAQHPSARGYAYAIEYYKDHKDPDAATRRAIVRAAAEIGKEST